MVSKEPAGRHRLDLLLVQEHHRARRARERAAEMKWPRRNRRRGFAGERTKDESAVFGVTDDGRRRGENLIARARGKESRRFCLIRALQKPRTPSRRWRPRRVGSRYHTSGGRVRSVPRRIRPIRSGRSVRCVHALDPRPPSLSSGILSSPPPHRASLNPWTSSCRRGTTRSRSRDPARTAPTSAAPRA